MDPKLSKLQQQQREELTTSEQLAQQRGHEFATPEEMLRHDAAHTDVPPAIAERLQESLNESPPARPWWQRFFGKM